MDTGQHHLQSNAAEPEPRRFARPPAASPGRAVRVSAICTMLLTVFLACFWTGCEVKVTRSNYASLSHWFDGVPDPDAPSNQGMGRGRRGTTLPVRVQVVSRHKPYVEQKCAECHKMAGERPEFALAVAACGKCHEKVPTQYPVMHGPVASGACLWCHAPHESSLPLLLRADSAQLCTQCHDRRLLSPETPEHQSEKKGCLDCHVGHGGTDRRLLKASLMSPGPVTRPASRPVAAAGW